MSSAGNSSNNSPLQDPYNTEKRMELMQMSQAVNLLGSWEWDLKSNTLFWTDAMFQLRAAPVSLNNVVSFEESYHFIHVDDREMFFEKLESLNQRQDVEFEYRLVTAEGETRLIMAWATMLRDENGEPVCMRGTSLDITKQREMEDQLVELNKSLSEKNEQLEKANKELGSFTYVASHDLQAPLGQIRTFINRLIDAESERLSNLGKDYLSRMDMASIRMQQLIDDLLNWSKTDRIEKTFKPYDLNKMIDEIKNSLKDFIEEQDVTIETNDLPVVNVIPFQFKQMFENLIINSIKYSKPSVAPHITIVSDEIDAEDEELNNIHTGKSYHRFSIADNGIGFDPQYSERIFELFQRLHDKHEYPGTGLGLAICKKIIENHKGFIRASAEPQNGATFTVYLPKA